MEILIKNLPDAKTDTCKKVYFPYNHSLSMNGQFRLVS